MKTFYKSFLKLFLVFAATVKLNAGFAQCPGAVIPGNIAYDTTLTTNSGSYSTEFKIPKFDPQQGLATCVRICLTITGRVTMDLENNLDITTPYNITYNRKDTLSGPGLSTPLTNSLTKTYGPYLLAASDGNTFSGPDYVHIGPDTVLKAVTKCIILTDSVDLVPFYGTDSLTYKYTIKAGATVTGSGDYLFSVATGGSVRFRFEYCYCPSATLPIYIRAFDAVKVDDDKAKLSWYGYDDANANYHYEIEMGRNGYNFTTIATIAKDLNSGGTYNHLFRSGNETGRFYFRVKQVYSNGYTRFTSTRFVDLDAAKKMEINVYPNPSDGIVGIKFANIIPGKYTVQISNAQGQTVYKRDWDLSGDSYRQITTLPSGTYWLRMTNVGTHASCVNQLLIK